MALAVQKTGASTSGTKQMVALLKIAVATVAFDGSTHPVLRSSSCEPGAYAA
jgi:hypothetical protein